MRLGYRKVAMVGGLSGTTTSERRLLGYKDALKEWKRPFDRALFYQGDFRVQSGYEAGIALLKKRPDGVFISNYQMAVGFMRALRQYQLRCPQDIAVVTCDDYPWIDSFQPRLTTVDLPKYELGAEGARVLIDRLAARERPQQRLELRSALTIRDSCGYGLRAKSV
jgi:DNA-binding LacI/PurR family transcriptional regulator